MQTLLPEIPGAPPPWRRWTATKPAWEPLLEVVRKTDADSPGKTDYSNDMDWRIGHSEETEGLDIKSK
uniref:Uncharacterized protein n=1 Tax=Anguilla anguilla TaxID=7936 RepID=A0A0E9QLI4_ANGAN